ncbi:MAG TPA: hypothetical protein VGV38_07065, partial [Pyrinomonadaceae bacterium]|nr:hypothetical protein [Pyrinomonadaceae bacterium]
MKTLLTASLLALLVAAPAAAQGQNADVRPGDTVRVVVEAPKEEKKESGGFSQSTKDWIDAVAKVVGLLSVFVAIIVAREQFRKNREESRRTRHQQANDLRWKKTELAKKVLDDMFTDPYASDAMLMLDWDPRTFYCRKHKSGKEVQRMVISWPEMWAAIRVVEKSFNDKEKFIRDCFDQFFGHMQIIEHYISVKLIEFKDVRYPFDYYIKSGLLKNRAAFKNFVETYHHPRATKFLSRFKGWDPKEPDASTPPPLSSSGTLPAAARAFFIFDCPPREEIFVLMLNEPQKIEQARDILRGGKHLHVNGCIVESAV